MYCKTHISLLHQTNAPFGSRPAPDQSFVMTETSNNVHIKFTRCCMRNYRTSMSIYISYTGQKWITRSAKLNLLQHSLNILRMFGAVSGLKSLRDVKIFNTTGGWLSYRETLHCRCTLGLSSEVRRVQIFSPGALLSIWTLGLWSGVQRCRLCSISDSQCFAH